VDIQNDIFTKTDVCLVIVWWLRVEKMEAKNLLKSLREGGGRGRLISKFCDSGQTGESHLPRRWRWHFSFPPLCLVIFSIVKHATYYIRLNIIGSERKLNLATLDWVCSSGSPSRWSKTSWKRLLRFEYRLGRKNWQDLNFLTNPIVDGGIWYTDGS